MFRFRKWKKSYLLSQKPVTRSIMADNLPVRPKNHAAGRKTAENLPVRTCRRNPAPAPDTDRAKSGQRVGG